MKDLDEITGVATGCFLGALTLLIVALIRIAPFVALVWIFWLCLNN